MFRFQQGIQLVWESYKLDQYVQRLAEQVFNFQEKVEDLLVVEEQLDVDVRSLETCPYSATTLADILAKIQHAIDDLSLRQYSNLHVWVNRLDLEVSFSDFCAEEKETKFTNNLLFVGREESGSSSSSRHSSLD